MLTTQQTRALELASNGFSHEEMAALMHVSVRTVEHHLSEARERLESKNTTHAVASAIRLNIIKCIIFSCCINSITMSFDIDIRQPSRTRINQSQRITRNLQIKTGRQKT